MQKYIAKFEAFDSSSLHDLFKEHNLTIVVLNDMIDKLEKYNLDHVLVNELKKSKERGYRDLRKWKIDSILSRYNSASRLIDMAETIEDYLLELTDNGYRIKVFPSNAAAAAAGLAAPDGYAVLLIYTKGVRKSRLARVAEVTSFLQHLNNSHRLNVELESTWEKNFSDCFKFFISEVNH